MPDHILKQARILIIDDEEMAADVLCRILEAQGYQEVKRILDPRKALAHYQRFQPDLVILDWMMPKLSGAKVLEQLRAEIGSADYLPILVVTALPHLETKQEALGGGATDFLSKPYQSAEIVLRVGNLLATRFLHLELKGKNELLEKRVEERTAELREANAALQHSAGEWEQSFDACPDLICVLDRNGKILRANRAMRALFEPRHGSLFGLDYRVCYCGSASPETQPPCAEVLTTGKAVMWEGKVPTLEGWYWIASYPLANEQGEVWGAVSIVRDLTGRKEAEAALRASQEELEERVRERTEELTLANAALSVAQVVRDQTSEKLRRSEERLTLAVTGGDLGIWDLDLIGQTVDASPRLKQMFGMPVGLGFVLEDFTAVIHPDDRDRLHAELDRTSETGAPYDIEYRVIWPDDTLRWIAARGKAQCDPDGKVIRIAGTTLDITSRKAAEAALRESEVRYAAIVENAPGMVYRTVRRPDGTVAERFMSDGCRALLEVEPADFDREPDLMNRLVHPDDREEFIRGGEEAIRSLRSWHWEGKVVLASGAVKCIECRSQAERREDGFVVWNGLLMDVTEERFAEEALRESDARYQRIAANAPGMVYQFIQREDGTMEFLYVSEGSRKLFGLEPGEIQADAQVLISRINPADREGFAASVEKSRRSGQDWNWEGRFAGASGEEIWISGSSRPVQQANGDVLWDGLLISITERKRAEASLAATEARFRQIVETAQEGIWVIDAAGRTTFANPKMATMLGVTATEMEGRSMYDFMDDDAREIAEKNMERRREGIAEQHEFRFRRSDGSPLWALTATNPLPASDGGFGGALAMVTDITARKEAEEQLRKAALENKQLASAVTNLTSGVVITDPSLPDNPMIFANPAFEAVTGYSSNEILGRNWRILEGPETDPAVLKEIRDAVAARRIFHGEVLNYRKDGSTFWNELTVTPVFDRTGALLNFVGLQSDITARRETALALQAAKIEADRANAAKSEFLSRMSHELRTPLNAILGFTQLAALDAESADERENVEQIQNAGTHLLHLINEILDLSSIEAGRMHLSLVPVPLRLAFEAALALVRPLAAQRRVDLADFTCDLSVRADEQRFQQVLLNLLSNAIKYNKEGGSVSLACERNERGFVRIEVRDTGLGLAECDLPALFQPFQRLHTETEEIEGLGLGLVICERLVTAMGGRIGAESEQGVGSTLWIELPEVDEMPEDNRVVGEPKVSNQRAASCDPRTLLYIEDNLANVKLVERIMALRPHIRLISAQRGSAGLEMARQHQPDLILLDLHLPDMNGDQVLTWLRRGPETARIPVVMLSADAIGGEVERLKKLGASAYMTKPFQVPDFLRMVDEAFSPKGATDSAA